MFAPASAQESEKAFYAGKTVRMIVGSGTGGGYDMFSRMIAPYLAKTLGTTVIVENQPGAGGLVALNRLYTATPDGLQISLSNGTSAAFAQLTGDQAARFDLAKFSYLATVGAPPGLWLVGPEFAHPGGAAGGRRQDEVALGVVRRDLRARHRRRLHLRGAQARLPCGAGLQGQRGRRPCGHARRDGRALRAGILRQQFRARPSRTGRWRRSRATKSRFFQDRPTIFEAAKMDADQTWVMDFLANVEKLGRILVAPPGIPPARLAYLQEAVQDHAEQSAAHRRRREGRAHHRISRSARIARERAVRRVERDAGAEAARLGYPRKSEVTRSVSGPGTLPGP